MKNFIMVSLLSLFLFSCTDEAATLRTLDNAGYSDVQTKGYSLWGCSDRDTFQTKFIARNYLGKKVSGVVCCGWFKKCTIRF